MSMGGTPLAYAKKVGYTNGSSWYSQIDPKSLQMLLGIRFHSLGTRQNAYTFRHVLFKVSQVLSRKATIPDVYRLSALLKEDEMTGPWTQNEIAEAEGILFPRTVEEMVQISQSSSTGDPQKVTDSSSELQSYKEEINKEMRKELRME